MNRSISVDAMSAYLDDSPRQSERPAALQADAVLSMALRRLTSLEAGRLQREDEELKAQIGGLQALLASPQAIRETVAREADSLAGSLGNDRRTLVRPHRRPQCTSCYQSSG